MLTYLYVREDDYWDDEDLEDLDKLAKELEEEAKLKLQKLKTPHQQPLPPMPKNNLRLKPAKPQRACKPSTETAEAPAESEAPAAEEAPTETEAPAARSLPKLKLPAAEEPKRRSRRVAQTTVRHKTEESSDEDEEKKGEPKSLFSPSIILANGTASVVPPYFRLQRNSTSTASSAGFALVSDR